jgi:DNA polymerase-3 subunit gamma/tau
LKGEEDIRRSSLPKIALEMLLVRLAKLPTLESLDRLLELLSLLENRMGGENLCLVSERVPSLRADATAGASSVRPSSTGRTSGHSGEPLGPDAPPSRLTSPESGFPGFDRVEKKTPEEAEDSREPEGVHIVAQSVVEDQYGARNTMRETPGDWTPDEVVSRWSDFLHWLQRRDPVLATKLDQSQLETGAEGAFELNVQEVYEDSTKEPQSLAKLMGSVGEFFGRDLEILIRSKSPAKESSQDPEKAKRPKSNPKLMVMEHPIVQQALEVLGAELLEIKTHKKVPAGRRAGGFLSEGKDS